MPEYRGIVLPLLAALVGAAANAFVLPGELWGWVRPRASALALRGLVWLREGDRG